MNKIKAGKAPGVCGIYPEYIQHGGSDMPYTQSHTAQNNHSIGSGKRKWFLRNGTRAS